MLITCPHCSFSRDIPEEKLPATAEMATCPKCRHKFRFRSLDQGEFDLGPAEYETPAPQGAPDAAHGDTPATSPDADAASFAGHGPDTAPGDETGPAPDEQPAVPQDDAPSTPGDIWQSLESMPRPGGMDPERQEPEQDAPGDTQGPDRPATDFGRTSFGRHFGPEGDESTQAAFGHTAPGDDGGEGRDAGPQVGEVPWENLDRHGFHRGFFLTIRQAMFSPSWFFRQMPLTRGLSKPLVFFLLVAQVQYVAQFVWERFGLFTAGFQATEPPPSLNALSTDILQLFVMYPLMSVGLLFLAAGLNHLFLLLFHGANEGFETTFKAAAYASAPQILGFIPVIGPILGAFWSLVCTVIAYRIVHRTSTGRVIAALLAPMIMVTLAFVLATLAGKGV